jgi:hypothetical protein
MAKPDMHRRPHPKDGRRQFHPRPYALRRRSGLVDRDNVIEKYEGMVWDGKHVNRKLK